MSFSDSFNNQQLAVEIVKEQERVRQAKDTRFMRVQDIGATNTNTLLTDLVPALAGRRGSIITLQDTGTGNVRMTIDGTDPSFNQIDGVNFDDVIFRGSSTGSDFTMVYEVYPV